MLIKEGFPFLSFSFKFKESNDTYFRDNCLQSPLLVLL